MGTRGITLVIGTVLLVTTESRDPLRTSTSYKAPINLVRATRPQCICQKIERDPYLGKNPVQQFNFPETEYPLTKQNVFQSIQPNKNQKTGGTSDVTNVLKVINPLEYSQNKRTKAEKIRRIYGNNVKSTTSQSTNKKCEKFPPTQYPLSAQDTWQPNYWNYLSPGTCNKCTAASPPKGNQSPTSLPTRTKPAVLTAGNKPQDKSGTISKPKESNSASPSLSKISVSKPDSEQAKENKPKTVTKVMSDNSSLTSTINPSNEQKPITEELSENRKDYSSLNGRSETLDTYLTTDDVANDNTHKTVNEVTSNESSLTSTSSSSNSGNSKTDDFITTKKDVYPSNVISKTSNHPTSESSISSNIISNNRLPEPVSEEPTTTQIEDSPSTVTSKTNDNSHADTLLSTGNNSNDNIPDTVNELTSDDSDLSSRSSDEKPIDKEPIATPKVDSPLTKTFSSTDNISNNNTPGTEEEVTPTDSSLINTSSSADDVKSLTKETTTIQKDDSEVCKNLAPSTSSSTDVISNDSTDKTEEVVTPSDSSLESKFDFLSDAKPEEPTATQNKDSQSNVNSESFTNLLPDISSSSDVISNDITPKTEEEITPIGSSLRSISSSSNDVKTFTQKPTVIQKHVSPSNVVTESLTNPSPDTSNSDAISNDSTFKTKEEVISNDSSTGSTTDSSNDIKLEEPAETQKENSPSNTSSESLTNTSPDKSSKSDVISNDSTPKTNEEITPIQSSLRSISSSSNDVKMFTQEPTVIQKHEFLSNVVTESLTNPSRDTSNSDAISNDNTFKTKEAVISNDSSTGSTTDSLNDVKLEEPAETQKQNSPTNTSSESLTNTSPDVSSKSDEILNDSTPKTEEEVIPNDSSLGGISSSLSDIKPEESIATQKDESPSNINPENLTNSASDTFSNSDVISNESTPKIEEEVNPIHSIPGSTINSLSDKKPEESTATQNDDFQSTVSYESLTNHSPDSLSSTDVISNNNTPKTEEEVASNASTSESTFESLNKEPTVSQKDDSLSNAIQKTPTDPSPEKTSSNVFNSNIGIPETINRGTSDDSSSTSTFSSSNDEKQVAEESTAAQKDNSPSNVISDYGDEFLPVNRKANNDDIFVLIFDDLPPQGNNNGETSDINNNLKDEIFYITPLEITEISENDAYTTMSPLEINS